MSKSLFNEPEQYLLGNWNQVRALETSMEHLRNKYAELFNKILDRVQEHHPELDVRSIRVTNYGNVCVAKSSWPLRYGRTVPPGFWIEMIGLDNILSADAEPPNASIWIQPPKNMELEDAKDKLFRAAQKIMNKAELKNLNADIGRASASIWYLLPQKRDQLRQMLFADDAGPFIEYMAGNFDDLARFVPVVDEIYNQRKQSGSGSKSKKEIRIESRIKLTGCSASRRNRPDEDAPTLPV